MSSNRILRPDVDLDRFATGLYWSKTPEKKPGPKYPSQDMGLDTLAAEQLSADTIAFINQHTAVCVGNPANAGDVFQGFSNRDTVVTQKVAEVILDLEPDKHELVPIPKTWSFQNEAPFPQPLFFLNIFQRMRTVDVARSDVMKSVRRADGKPFTYLTSLTAETCVLLPEVNQNESSHLWRDTETLQTFMSVELVTALEKADVRGLVFTRCTEGA